MNQREESLRLFHETHLLNIKNGLNIGTLTQGIKFDLVSEKMNTVTEATLQNINLDHIEYSDILEFNSENKFDHLHRALCNINVLTMDDSKPITIMRDSQKNSFEHLLIIVKEKTNAELLLMTESSAELSTDNIQVILENNSSLNIVDLRVYKNIVYSRKSARIGDNSRLIWTSIEGPSKLNITESKSLIMNNSDSIINTLVLAADSEYNLFNKSDHVGSGSKSLIQSRAILKNSKAILRGMVKIREDAFASNGYQKTDMLMLDKISRAISIPELEINNHDVKCTHGSSIERIDDMKMFYLKSRGVAEKDAQRLIIKGFYTVMLECLNPEFKDKIVAQIESITEDIQNE